MIRAHLPCAALALLAALAVGARAQQARTTGSFTDKDGKPHAWSVLPSHALIWDASPYLPVGGVFCPRWLAEGATEENWTRDAAALDAVQKAGIADLLIDPVVSAADVPAAAWQRLVDDLDRRGFRYGVALGAGVSARLTGTVVRPASYRVPGASEGGDTTWSVPDCQAARYVYADARDGTHIVAEGAARVRDGVASASLPAGSGEECVALLYPRKAMEPSAEGWLPDLWSGFDAYRDRLLASLGKVRFGPGLRFFLDPLARPLGVSGEADFLVPDTPGFRVEWEAFLSRRYKSLEDLMNAWSLVDREVKDFRQAVRLVPLWAHAKGVPFLLDATDGKRLQVNGPGSRFWSDLRAFRAEGIAYYMGAAADILKREVANVPVLYTQTEQDAMFTNARPAGGFDGLGIAAAGASSAASPALGGAALSQAEGAARTMWLVVTEVIDAAPAADRVGYESPQAMYRDLDRLRAVGAKGFFVRGLQVLPDSGRRHEQLVQAPEQMEWLRDYAARIGRETAAADARPRVLPFPRSAAGIVPAGPIGTSSVWWVPSLAEGKPLDMGSTYAGYTIRLPDGDALVLWSLTGPRATRLAARDPRRVEVFGPDGQPVEAKVDGKKHLVTVTIDSTPCVVRTGGQQVFPIEAAEDTIAELSAMIDEAAAVKVNAASFKYDLTNARERLRLKEPDQAFHLADQSLQRIIDLLLPYTWREAEQAEQHTFGEAAPVVGASQDGALVLNTSTRPPREGYAAQYQVGAPRDDTYTVWLAASPLGPGASPFAWVMDAGEAHSSADARSVGVPYLDGTFTWLRLGTVKLRHGQHTFTLRVTDRAASGRYAFRMDALLLTRDTFAPRGTIRPAVGRTTAAAAAAR